MTDLSMEIGSTRQVGELSRQFGERRRQSLGRLTRRVWRSKRAMSDSLMEWGVDMSPDRCLAILNAEADLRLTDYFAVHTAAKNELALLHAALVEADLERMEL